MPSCAFGLIRQIRVQSVSNILLSSPKTSARNANGDEESRCINTPFSELHSGVQKDTALLLGISVIGKSVHIFYNYFSFGMTH